MPNPRTSRPLPTVPDERALLQRVLDTSWTEFKAKKGEDAVVGGKITSTSGQTYFATRFAANFGREIETILKPLYKEITSGEVPSESARGSKRVDVRYSTLDAGLGLLISFKSVHSGEKENGDSHFNHNMKRNDEELRVEATSHHLRQPYAVLIAVVFLPIESCHDRKPKPKKAKKGSAKPTKERKPEPSSFAHWVRYLWALKGREEVEDPPDRFELVFFGLYERDASRLGFYEVGGQAECPRRGVPELMTLEAFLKKIKVTYETRNGATFFFAGEKPKA